MTKENVIRVLEEQMQPIFGFCLKKCARLEDAEDLAQEIVLRAFRSLVLRDDIRDIPKFIWTIAHNTLANYYRDKARKNGACVSLTEDFAAESQDAAEDLIERETYEKLHREIAYLSKMQRKIVIEYYYEGKRQEQIANELDLPLGTVKWHLFEAKKELKRSMNCMRSTKELKFNPIRFSLMGFNGTPGTMGGTPGFFRSVLSQNIVYCVFRRAKNVREIADELGVSPVYIESDVEFLEKYGYLLKMGDSYLANVLIDDLTDERMMFAAKLAGETYKKIATTYANALYEALMDSGVLYSERIECCYQTDKNYLLWALIPYSASNSADEDVEKIRFEEVATRRADGAFDIANVTVETERLREIPYYDSIERWCGPSWNSGEDWMLWGVKHEWSADIDRNEFWACMEQRHLKSLYRMQCGEKLSKDEYAALIECGCIKMVDGKAEYAVVCVKDRELKTALLEIGAKIKREYAAEFSTAKERITAAYRAYTPKHLQRAQEYQLQYIFNVNGWFLLYCLKELIANGKLHLPTEEQRRSLSMLYVPM